MKRFAAITLLLLLVILGAYLGIESLGRAKHVDDIREAVFRHQFRTFGMGWTGLVPFLAIGDLEHDWKDPTDRFMQRFRLDKPAVRKVSLHTFQDAKGVIDPQTGKRGIIYYVSRIRWLSKTEVEVKGGFYVGKLASSGNTYRLTLKNGRWLVTKDVMDWVS